MGRVPLLWFAFCLKAVGFQVGPVLCRWGLQQMFVFTNSEAQLPHSQGLLLCLEVSQTLCLDIIFKRGFYSMPFFSFHHP